MYGGSAVRFPVVAIVVLIGHLGLAQPPGSLAGRVVLKSSGQPVHEADVMIPRLGLKTATDPEGRFLFAQVPAGSHEVLAHLHGLSDARQKVYVRPDEAAEALFELHLTAIREQITVTASGRVESAMESLLTVVTASQLDLAAKSGSTSLGDLLSDQPGIHKRSFGPGTTRPVIRGFDGDRVLVLEDGVRTGTLSSQSGDHGEPIDPNQVERIEVVRGPATLLYGSNAIGGVINAVSAEHELHEKPHRGLSGSLSGTAGSNNGQGGGGAALRYGAGNWLFWAGGAGMRTGDYGTAEGRVPNSVTRIENGRFGIGRHTERASFNFGYGTQRGRYGVPFASEFHAPAGTGAAAEEGEEEVDIAFRRHQVRFTGSLNDLGRSLERLTLKLNYTDWNHRELEGDTVGTEFFNKQFVYRGDFYQRRRKAWSGTFGFWGMTRDFRSAGEEALSPPVDQNAFALFALEQLDYEKVRFQFGGRLERNSLQGAGVRNRDFNTLSASAGLNAPLWPGGVLAANFTHAERAPSLEELYYNGPHIGNLAFEVGNDNLRRERGNGVDISLRHQSQRFRGELNFFYYRMANFVYLAPTGEMEDGLPEAEYAQRTARFSGSEASASFGLSDTLWLNAGFDLVNATLVDSGTPLPRIPPVRGRVGLDFRLKNWSVRPELSLANRQSRVFSNEQPTAGYVVPGVQASYSVARQHTLHVFTVNVFNLSDRIYRNHLSFIRQFAPEMGRGMRIAYNLHFY
jgi:iron complex outermembrane receptor protein